MTIASLPIELISREILVVAAVGYFESKGVDDDAFQTGT
jgi:hypothetical protein